MSQPLVPEIPSQEIIPLKDPAFANRAKWGDKEVALIPLTEKDIQTIQAELNFLSQTPQHPNVETLYGITDGPRLVFEWKEGGSLHSKIYSGNWDGEPILKIALGMAKGLAYLHSQKITHGSFKSKSVLLNQELEPAITDLGQKKLLDKSTSKSTNPKFLKEIISWSAPEQQTGDSDEKVDVYALGLVIWEMFMQKPPFDGCSLPTLISKKAKNESETIDPEKIPEPYIELLNECWKEAKERPKSQEVLETLQKLAPEEESFPSVVIEEKTELQEVLEAVKNLAPKEEDSTNAALGELYEINSEVLNAVQKLAPKEESSTDAALGEIYEVISDVLVAVQKLASKEESTTSAAADRISLERAAEVPIVSEIAFGAKDWNIYFGDVGEEPPLPVDIEEILQSPCPFWPNQKVSDTHFLCLIPKTVNGKPLTLDNLQELVKTPKQGNPTKYSYYWEKIQKEHGSKPVEHSYWVLMTKDVIPYSRGNSYEAQKDLVEKTALYEMPRLIEAATVIFMHIFKTGDYIYTDNKLGKQWTYTRCLGKNTGNLGGLSADGLGISNNSLIATFSRFDGRNLGVGGVRKFTDSL